MRWWSASHRKAARRWATRPTCAISTAPAEVVKESQAALGAIAVLVNNAGIKKDGAPHAHGPGQLGRK